MATKRVCDECGKEADVIWDVEIKASRMDVADVREVSTGSGVMLGVPRHQTHRGDLCDACLTHMAAPFAPGEQDDTLAWRGDHWERATA